MCRKLTLPAKLSWFVMEVPSYLVSLAAILHLVHTGVYGKILLLLPFNLHYLNRSVLYPLSIKNGRPFPVIASSSAFLFTLFNGVLQSHSIISSSNTETSLNIINIVGIIIFITGMCINIQVSLFFITLSEK